MQPFGLASPGPAPVAIGTPGKRTDVRLPFQAKPSDTFGKSSTEASFTALTDPQPVLEKKDEGIWALGVIKTLVGGMIVGGTVAMNKGLKFWPMVCVDMVLGVGETLLAKWIIDGKSPTAKHLLSFSSKFSRAPHKPVDEMNTQEKEMALTPISAIASVASALGTLGIGDKLEEKPWMKAKPITQASVNEATGFSKAIKSGQLRLLNTLKKAKPPEAIRSNGIYKKLVGNNISKTVIAALAVGVLEGVLAEHLKKHEEKRAELGRPSLTHPFR